MHREARGGLLGEGAGMKWPIPAWWDRAFLFHPVGDHHLPTHSPQHPPGPWLEATPGPRCSELRAHYSSTRDMLHTLFVCISGE